MSMNKRVGLILVGVVILIIVGLGMQYRKGENPKAASSGAPQLKKVTVAQAFEVFLYAPLYIAQDKGFFTEEGLDVSLVTAGGDEKAFAALLSKDAQFAIGDPAFVAVAGEKGQPGKVVASVLSGMPFWGVAHKDSIPQITDPSMLKGLSVATFPAPSTAFAAQTKMFQSGNLSPNIQQVAFGSLLAALDNNQVDVALELEPNVSTAVKNGDRIVYSLAKYYPDFALTGLTVLEEYNATHQHTIQRFVNALRKADIFIAQHPAEAAGFMSKRFTQVDSSVAASALQNMIDEKIIPLSMAPSRNGWDTAIQLRREVGDITQPAPYELYIESKYAKSADEIK